MHNLALDIDDLDMRVGATMQCLMHLDTKKNTVTFGLLSAFHVEKIALGGPNPATAPFHKHPAIF